MHLQRLQRFKVLQHFQSYIFRHPDHFQHTHVLSYTWSVQPLRIGLVTRIGAYPTSCDMLTLNKSRYPYLASCLLVKQFIWGTCATSDAMCTYNLMRIVSTPFLENVHYDLFVIALVWGSKSYSLTVIMSIVSLGFSPLCIHVSLVCIFIGYLTLTAELCQYCL